MQQIGSTGQVLQNLKRHQAETPMKVVM